MSDLDHLLLYLSFLPVKERRAEKGMQKGMQKKEMVFISTMIMNFIQLFWPDLFLFSEILSCPVVNQELVMWQLEDK